MIDLSQEDARLIREANQKYTTTDERTGKYYDFDSVLQELVNKKNEQLNKILQERLNDRVEEIAMQRAKDINGIPVRTLIAKDIVTTMIGSGKLNSELNNADIARISVDMTDELLKALKR